MRPQLRKLRVPGLAAGILEDGKLVCTAVAGKADIEHGRAVTADTLFLVASISKTVTATALMQLEAAGRLDLDDDVNAYLPFAVRNPRYPHAPITFAQLLTHTSSITDNAAVVNCPLTCGYGGTFTPIVTRGRDSPIPLRTLVEEYLTPGGKYYDRAANFGARRPGTESAYSNMAVTLMGYLVERISGVPFERYTRQHIFAPLGMDTTSWTLARIDPSRLAMPYDWAKRTGYVPYGQYGEPDYPDGMVRSSVHELARFLGMYMRGGRYHGKRVLRRRTVHRMLKPGRTPLDDGQGLIWYWDYFNESPMVVGHEGSDLGASASMFFDPVSATGVILLANGAWRSAHVDRLMKRLLDEGTD